MKKHMKGRSRLYITLIAACVLALLVGIFAIATAAASSIETVGEMVDIKATFADYLVQDTVRAKDDGYVGETQYTVYYDTSKGKVKTGYEGTPVVVYSINHPGVERLGTDSNETIIKSMLDRGYVVVVLDYLNNEKAVSPAIDWSSQQFRTNLRNGKILTNSSVFPSGSYDENFLAPSGCNVLLNQVFWEIDKHATSGTLEKIVENWNSDFRATKGSKFVKWTHADGTRKAVQYDLDGNAPVWYNANQQVDPNGSYTYIRFTKAETITDCVDPDGSFIDMNLYINIVYPTNPVKEVPVMSLANSSGYPTTSVTSADLRPHSNGFLYNGYANVVFDYLWVPMARSASWGYYDGSQGITQDHMNYAVMMYNDKLVNTAAMRYLRYLSVTGGNTYNFDLDAFGVYGNSKGGWFSFLGEEAVQSALATGNYATELERLQAIDLALSKFTPDRYYNGHHGETRYQEGEGVITKDGFTVKAGELQPWLTYPDGTEIVSGCQLTYAQNGSQQEDITAGHSPVFVSSHMNDTYNAAYGYSNDIVNICRELDIPLLNFELNLGHTLAYDYDMKYGTDAYDAFFRYVNFYLNGGALTVAYTDPYNNDGGIALTNDIVIRFAGAVSASEIAKVTVKAAGVTVNGTWSSQFGGTEWTFTPDMLVGGTKYTVTVPADLQGTNGNKMASEYSFDFITEFDAATAITETVGAAGRYYSFKAPALTTGNSFVFRFSVANKAANVAELYAVDSTTATSGTLLGAVNLRGNGSYEIDITDYIAQRAGESTVLLLKAAKAASDTVVLRETFDASGSYSKGSYVTLNAGTEIAGEKALKVTITSNVTKGVSVYQDNTTHVLTYGKVTGGYKTTADQLGRTYTIELDIYDTISRTVQLKMNSMTKRVDYGTIDYDHKLVHVTTKANEWVHVAITYTVYEADYGKPALDNVQSLALYISPDGDTKAPIYFNDLVVTEHVTDIDVIGAVVAEKNDGTGAYVAPVSTNPFAVYNGTTKVGEYATWKTAFAAYKNGYTVKLQRDYTLTDNDLYSDFEAFTNVNVDLGGYTVTCANTKNSLLWMKSTGKTTNKTFVTIANGAVLLDRTPLASYESSTAKGAGKEFEINLNSVYVGLVDYASTSELISANVSDVKTLVTVSLNECVIDVDSYTRPYDNVSIFPAPADNVLVISYRVIGGTLKLNCSRYVTCADNAQLAEFFEGNNGYTKLIYPAAKTPNLGSFMREDGYAKFETATPDNATNLTTWELYKSANSTRYGVIDEAYANASTYPYVVFLDGNFKGGYSAWNTVTNAAAALVKGEANANKTAVILFRADNTIGAACGALNGIGGTLVIDLGGHTVTRNKLFLDLSPNTTDASLYMDTNIIVKNGELRTLGNTIGATQSWVATKQVAHKTFNLTFDNVTIGAAPGATGFQVWTIWANSAPATAPGTTTNMTLNDCTLDLTTNYPTKSVTAFAFTDANLVNGINFVMNGGTIVASNPSATTLFTTDANDTLRFGRGSDGNYTTLTVPSGKTPFGGNFISVEGDYRYFELVNDNGTTASYELAINKNSTKYGVIAPEYSDAQKYPFVLFDQNGNFIGAYTHFMNTSDSDANADAKDLMQYAKGLVSGAGKAADTAYVLLRRDYTLGETGVNEAYNNLSQIGGTLVIDLDGNTLALGEKTLFDANKKATSGVVHDSTIEVINGEIVVGTKAMIVGNHTASATEAKNFNITFEDVAITVNSTAVSTSTLIYTNKGAGAGLNLNVDFIDCTFNLDTNVGKAVTLFNMTGDGDNISVSVNVKGGKIVSNASAMANITFGSFGSNDKINFAKLDGEYTSMTYPTSDTPITKTFPTAAGDMYFYKFVEEGVISTYYLRNYDFDKELIESDPAKYLTVLENPFVIFIMNGNTATYHAAYPTYIQAFAAASTLLNGEANKAKVVKILMLRDADTGSDGSSPNISGIGGTLILDLGNNTLTRSNSRYVFDLYGQNNYATNIVIENGTILVGTSKPIIGLDHSSNVKNSNKIVNFTFNDVTIGFAKGSTGGTLMSVWDTGTGYGTTVTAIFNNCTFDLTNAATNAKIFNVMDPSTKNGGTVDVAIVINGGKLVANSFTAAQFYYLDSKDSLKLGKGADGNYMYVQMSATAALPAMSFTTVSGEPVSFGLFEKNDLRATYLIGESIKTEYGYIPFGYSEKDYPFAVFNEKGDLLGMSKYFYGPNKADSAIGIAKDYMAGNVWAGNSYGSSPRAAVILMRCDYTFIADERFDNLSQIQGELVIDLGGYTLANAGTRYTFPACIKPWSGSGDASIFPTTITIKNGGMNVLNRSLIQFSVWANAGAKTDEKAFTYNFYDVTFGYEKGAGVTSLIVDYAQHSNTPDAIGNTWLNFIDCTFDMSKAPTGAVIINNAWEYVNNTVTIKGGEIISNSGELAIETVNDLNTSGVTFLKGDDGQYTTLSVPTGAILAEDTVNGGKLTFVQVDQIGGLDIYKLRASELANVNVTPLGSVVLWRDLIFNVYVPKSAALKSFTLDGVVYTDLDALATATVEGNEYYVVGVPLASDEAARSIPLVMTLAANGSDATVSYSFSTVKYAKLVLARGTEVECKVVCDILSYIRAAYAYFGTEDATAIAEIDAILGEGYDENNKHTDEGSADSVTTGLAGATLVLDATPAIRFYLAEGADASAYEFFIGESRVKTVSGTDTTGAYIEIDVYAYAMCETVTYTVNGEAGGSYHIASYYAYATAKGDAKLIALVDRMWKYFQSARDYRASVIG